MGVEEHELDGRAVVRAAHFIGLAPVVRRQVIEHVEQHRRNAAFLGIDQAGAVGAVDQARGQVEDQVHQPRARRARDQLPNARPHARKRARFGKQR